MIIQLDHAIVDADCDRLMEIYDACAKAACATDYSGFPVVHWPSFRHQEGARDIVGRLVTTCRSRMMELVGSSEQLFPETIILATMGVGGRHPRHADNRMQNECGEWLPNHTPQRDISAIFYLNGDFDGGEIIFDQQKLLVKPRRGLLIAFPSDEKYTHEVCRVRAGFRYTAPIWFTKQKMYAFGNSETDDFIK
jgi:2OG-Fe(II) oxygenase superfamily